MTYLAIIFIPPLYFLARKKWGGFILNSILYGIACACVLTFVFALIGVFFWMLAVGHASFAYRRELASVQADLIATKMAEKMQHLPPKI